VLTARVEPRGHDRRGGRRAARPTPPLRAALASLRAGEPIHLNVGDDGLLTTTLDGSVMEEKVPLPIRWLKGFAETQMLSSRMSPVHSLDAAAARTFIHSLPRNSSTKAVLWATRAVRSLRLATRATAGSVCVAGPERLRVLEPLIRHIQRLDAYSEPVTAGNAPVPSVWVAHLPGARLSIGLSPEKSRGFSGEGSVLQALSNPNTAQNADMLSVLLSFEPRIDVPVMSARAGLDEAATRDALALLASSGQVGFDAHAGEYFHRPLPVHPEALTAMHPRLVGAKKLADSGAIERVGAGEHGTGEYETMVSSLGPTVFELAGHDRGEWDRILDVRVDQAVRTLASVKRRWPGTPERWRAAAPRPRPGCGSGASSPCCPGEARGSAGPRGPRPPAARAIAVVRSTPSERTQAAISSSWSSE